MSGNSESSPDSGLIILARHLAAVGHERAALAAHYQAKGEDAPMYEHDVIAGAAATWEWR